MTTMEEQEKEIKVLKETLEARGKYMIKQEQEILRLKNIIATVNGRIKTIMSAVKVKDQEVKTIIDTIKKRK